VQGFFDFVKSLGAARMAAMAEVTLALIGFFAFLMTRMTTPQMVPLFTDLSMDDSAFIIKDLDRQGITYALKNDGSIILVPARDHDGNHQGGTQLMRHFIRQSAVEYGAKPCNS
jgi:flagellar M-ring protein FliF